VVTGRYIRQLCGDSGETIEPALRRDMENLFGADFTGIRVHCSDAAAVATALIGGKACTDGRDIFFRRGMYRPETARGRLLLAHELAHVVQKQRGRQVRTANGRSPGTARLEREAYIAAHRVLRKQPANALSADPSTDLRAWGEAGHYYTVYWVALACGWPNNHAQRLAFYAQMPDQVIELDAIPQGFTAIGPSGLGEDAYNFAFKGGFRAAPLEDHQLILAVPDDAPWYRPAKLNHSTDQYTPYSRERPTLYISPGGVHYSSDDVQMGLHCLTGEESNMETTKRADRIRRLPLDDFTRPVTSLSVERQLCDLGLALHAYGDSFAHRDLHNPMQMYLAPLGHGFHGSQPDYIYEHRQFYVQYGLGMYRLLCEKTPFIDGQRLITAPDVEPLLAGVSSLPDKAGHEDASKIVLLRTMINDLLDIRRAGEKLSDYRPEIEGVHERSRTSFLRAHQQDGVVVDRIEQALRDAVSWATGATRIMLPRPSMTITQRPGVILPGIILGRYRGP
jgi:hypothetical protein